jgi:mannose-6-phosphate isomerase-like protein (cupin superfamily)
MINQKYGKIWGNTQEIFNINNISIHRIEIFKGGQCSKHCHKHKYNMFFIEKGKIKIDIWQNDYDLVDSTILVTNQSTIVKPGLNHQFTALEDTVCYEIYYLLLEDNDIIRTNVGQLLNF